MKYSTTLTISLPRGRVVELFNSTENLYKWQEGLLRFEHLDGDAGKAGAVSTLVYTSRKGELLMTETIVKNDLPDSFNAEYRSKGVYNLVENLFSEENGQTRWETIHTFRFRGMMALMAPFMKTAFSGNTLLQMERFKIFAEQETQE